MDTRPIIALDFPNQAAVVEFLQQFPQGQPLFVKIGMELFYSAGPDIVRALVAAGHDVFLDLKLYDIPHTVEKSMQVLGNLGVTMTNVHASGGREMMQAAKQGLLAGSHGQKPPKLIAVTQLTSTNQAQIQQEQLITASLTESVTHLAQLADQAGLDGVVCSALEAEAIKRATRADFLCITPGIRLTATTHDDQKRIATPANAAKLGSSQLVVGRPITQAKNPVVAYQEIKKLWEESLV
ncbi:orotidine-5'-phosphate decarboxylase [Loigolactobacillus backii]|uniref:Orotidine 5'-phosphate decarboxylase n=1 Tax=Loigolactobacillus backii TaxID=375175 RepID=A0A192H3V8_9LACO|nr:orotidine-5'-phosphate decarboxylase [Loigolactobacillus backii]ANK59503.1 orotidine 5'-phosphate decarboxylase [Loigolactobacillus backii]ANK62938.1 orotidine 5'-phosphate decarboxylase [Loigolactobacillus backii]ANK64496.1 orotidine 5'-phosphate decarboxylase [Loigolactobacillus backii]ANK67108.1 orotidine 5'-phosphate decarboxylase [Loigolactobacillus backii]ANK70054.1 orotidine 5'-phosphate decarboxylase [Loigolactobacillus backii]